jgi:chromosome segregation ATPase
MKKRLQEKDALLEETTTIIQELEAKLANAGSPVEQPYSLPKDTNKAADDQADADIVAEIHSMKAEIERLTNENKILKTKAESSTVAASSSSTAGPIDANNYVSRKKYESLDSERQALLQLLKDAQQKINLLKSQVASGSAGTPAKAVAAAGSSTNPPPAPENGSINDEEYKKLKKKVCPLYMILDSKLRY